MSRNKTGRKHARQMEYLIEQWKAGHPEEDGGPIEPHRIAPWALKRGLWVRPPMSPEEILRRELAKFLKNEYITDPQNRNVRKNHAVIIEVKTQEGVKRRSRWYTLYEAPPKHMQASLQLRRRAALADVVQLELDFNSYNDMITTSMERGWRRWTSTSILTLKN